MAHGDWEVANVAFSSFCLTTCNIWSAWKVVPDSFGSWDRDWHRPPGNAGFSGPRKDDYLECPSPVTGYRRSP